MENRAHFFGAAAEAMRRILIDQARHKGSLKRGGSAKRVDLEVDIVVPGHSGVSPEELLALDDALQEFEALDPVRARVVKLHYFSGFTLQETAEALGVSLEQLNASGSLPDLGCLEKCAIDDHRWIVVRQSTDFHRVPLKK